METQSNPADMAKLYAKLAKVMGGVTRLHKDGRNQYHNYTYPTAQAVAEQIRALLAENNVAFFAEMVDKSLDNGIWIVEFEFTFACGDSGATKTCRWSAEAPGMNSKGRDDKGLNKAATIAEKFFLLKTFVMSASDDIDPDGEVAPPAANGTGKGSEQKPQASAAKQWEQDEARRWLTETMKRTALSEAQLYQVLGIKERLGEWQAGTEAADAAVARYIETKIAAKKD